jgi:lysophospholipase L1-like esterase
MIKNFKWLLLVSLSFVACNNDDESLMSAEVAVVPGTASFAKYVALGDSFAAGYSDGALFVKGQEGSYTNLLSQQFALAGGGEFKTPLMVDNIGGFSSGGVQIPQFATRLYFNGVGPVNVPGVTGTAITARLTGAFNNMGVPGAKSFHLGVAGYGTLNPYFGRFATTAGATILGDALVQAPTFFSLWIGGNDALSYAISGGTGTNQTTNLNPATYGVDDITNPNVFASVYSGLINGLTANGAKGVVANFPYITALPYFTTVPYNPLTTSVLGAGNIAVGTATVAALNAQLYGPLHNALAFLNQGSRIAVLSSTVTNPMLIKDESLTNLAVPLTQVLIGGGLDAATAGQLGFIFGQVRQSTSTDLILLPTRSVIGTAPTAANSGLGVAPAFPLNSFGITFPLQDKHVLIPTEIAEVRVATDAYNVTVKAIAASKGLAFVDTKALLDKLSNGGVVSNSFTITSTYVTGGMFSLDGIHPSPRGYALIANAFSAAINTTYESTLPMIDVGLYPILYPAGLK